MLYVKKMITVINATVAAAKRSLKRFKFVLDSHPDFCVTIAVLQMQRSKV